MAEDLNKVKRTSGMTNRRAVEYLQNSIELRRSEIKGLSGKIRVLEDEISFLQHAKDEIERRMQKYGDKQKLTFPEEIRRLHAEGKLEYGENVMNSLCIGKHGMAVHVYIKGVGWFCKQCLDEVLSEASEYE